jgi:hypothetical protein
MSTPSQAAIQPHPSGSLTRPVTSQGFAIGLGLTNEGNLSCSFCYRDPAAEPREH